MKAQKLVLHCFAEKAEDQWSAVCLDFTLAAQADTFEEARKKLHQMICEYVYDAVAGEDKQYRDQLLKRRAPLRDWIRFYFYKSLFHYGAMKDELRRIFVEPMPNPDNCRHA